MYARRQPLEWQLKPSLFRALCLRDVRLRSHNITLVASEIVGRFIFEQRERANVELQPSAN